jgi:hypothetical protein
MNGRSSATANEAKRQGDADRRTVRQTEGAEGMTTRGWAKGRAVDGAHADAAEGAALKGAGAGAAGTPAGTVPTASITVSRHNLLAALVAFVLPFSISCLVNSQQLMNPKVQCQELLFADYRLCIPCSGVSIKAADGKLVNRGSCQSPLVPPSPIVGIIVEISKGRLASKRSPGAPIDSMALSLTAARTNFAQAELLSRAISPGTLAPVPRQPLNAQFDVASQTYKSVTSGGRYEYIFSFNPEDVIDSNASNRDFVVVCETERHDSLSRSQGYTVCKSTILLYAPRLLFSYKARLVGSGLGLPRSTHDAALAFVSEMITNKVR